MRKSGLLFIALVVLAAGAVAAIAFLVPPGFYKQKIEQRASAMLGRDLRISGPVALKLWPNVQVRAEHVSIANPPGFSQASLASMKTMRVSIALLPLLSRQVVIRKFILVEPEVTLERRKNGAVNWALGTGGQAKKRVAANAGFKRAPGALPLQAALGRVQVVNGDFRLVDAVSGLNHHASGINLGLSMPGLSAPLALIGKLTLDDRDYRIEALLGGLKPFLEGARTPLTLKLQSALFSADFDGAFDKSAAIAARGNLRLDIPSVHKLAAAADTPLAGSEKTFGRFSVTGFARANSKRLSFQDAEVRFDDVRAKGSFGAFYAGPKPRLSGTLSLASLDLTPYLPPQGKTGAGLAPWSTQVFDLGMLNAADVHFSLDLGTLTMRQITIGKSALKAKLVNGRLEAKLTKMALYDGSGTAKMVLNGRAKPPSFSLSADVAGISFQPLLRDAIQFKRLAGTGAGHIALSGRGNSQAALMRVLQGQGTVRAKDGQIIGVNLAAVLRSGQGILASGALPASLKADLKDSKATDFSDMQASFTVSGGVARSDDFLLVGPLIRVPGEGVLDIGGQSVDFRLRPRAVASLKGQGGKKDVAGFAAPFRIHGPWNAIKAGLDTKFLKKRAKKRVKQGLGKLIDNNMGKDSGTGSALKSLFGVQQSPPPDAAQAKRDEKAKKTDEEKALDAFSGLFKKKKKQKTPPK